MKKQNIGFAFLLLGVIFVVTIELILWWIEVILGIVGLIIGATNAKGEN